MGNLMVVDGVAHASQKLAGFSKPNWGIGWKTATVRLFTATYSHSLTCSSVNILWHTSGSIVITLRTYRITFAHLETQHSISLGLWRETGNLGL